MKIELESLISCFKCGCVFDYFTAGTYSKRFTGDKQLTGCCPCCGQKYEVEE